MLANRQSEIATEQLVFWNFVLVGAEQREEESRGVDWERVATVMKQNIK